MIIYRKVRFFFWSKRVYRSGRMDRNGFLVLFFMILIVSEGSDASMFRNFQKMLRIVLKEKSAQEKISPSPSPVSNTTQTGKNPLDSQVTDHSLKANANDSVINKTSVPHTENSRSNEGNKSKGPVDPQEVINEKCEAFSNINSCSNQKMIACLRHAESGSDNFLLLVQNDGESTLKANVTAPDYVKIPFKELEIPKNRSKKMNISINGEKNPDIVLKSENGDCVLHTGSSIFKDNFLQRLPSYATQVTPIYAAYILVLIALIIGGTWACCKFSKRGRPGDGVPYQELEMAVPESVSVINSDTAQGWDQGWDDDWDEEKAVKSPGVQNHAGNVSGNGLTSRSSNRDGWENNWDD